ncbi:serine aminopeptidase domain-containing protein [Pseudanabaena sp. PCC 6802]|uniref:alpha/beta hydrolase n=1 Tax=Pseudanabaena sp. PCC 6802 TaxID=118173 RepID=UPI0003466360
MRSLQIPVLFIHGTKDDVVPMTMSQRLYDAAPEPKQLLLVPGAGHYRIYQPGANSYLREIEKFVKNTESVRMAKHGDIVDPALLN